MKKSTKLSLIFLGGLVLLFLAVVFIVPMMVDEQKYRTIMENRISEAAGRPFKLDGDLRLSLFPWASIAVSDVRLENPAGFEEKDFINIKSFEVQVKLVPLVLSLFKDIQVKRFTLEGARIVLEIRNDGTANWEGKEKGTKKLTSKGKDVGEKKPGAKQGEVLPVTAIEVGEFAITKSSLVFIDHRKGERFQISDLNLLLKDVSLDRPIQTAFSALVDGHPLSIEGNVGPLGKDLSKGTIPMDFSLNAMKQLELKLKGSISDAASNPRLDIFVESSPFSPRKLFAAMEQDFPVTTADPKALTRLSFRANFDGASDKVSVSEGVIHLDESTLNFSGKAGDLSKPDIVLDVNLDEIDLDRYLAPETDEDADGNKEKAGAPGQEKSGKGQATGQQKTDYERFRRLVLNGSLHIGKLKAADARIQDLALKVAGKDGVFNLDPLSLNLYKGTVSVKGSLNVKGDTPLSRITLQAKGIEAGPLVKDMFEKDILEGKLNAETVLEMKGDESERIKASLNGKGLFFVQDGTVKGIDLAAMVRNTDGAYGFAGKGGKQPRTEFSELQVPFTIINGIFHTEETRMASSLFRIQAKGKADLVNETLDFRLVPTIVTTRSQDKDKMKRSEVMIPVLVGGSFSSPKFRPDLKGIAEKKLEEKVFESSDFKKVFEKEELKPFEDDVKKVLKGILDKPVDPRKSR